MPDEEWIKTLEDGRKVKFIYQVLPEDGAFITAQIAWNEIVYSVVLTKAGNPLSREDVESHFEGGSRRSNDTDCKSQSAGATSLVSEILIGISGSVRNTANLLEVLIATKITPLFGLRPARA